MELISNAKPLLAQVVRDSNRSARIVTPEYLFRIARNASR